MDPKARFRPTELKLYRDWILKEIREDYTYWLSAKQALDREQRSSSGSTQCRSRSGDTRLAINAPTPLPILEILRQFLQVRPEEYWPLVAENLGSSDRDGFFDQ